METETAAPPLLRADGIVKTYGRGEAQVSALRGVSLDVGRGEFVAVVGGRGSGKTTLINVVGCVDRPTAGSCVLTGMDVTRLSNGKLARVRCRALGFVFHQFNLLPDASALENVELPMFHQGMPLAERRPRALEALDRVGLLDTAGRPAGELSAGEQLRVAVARALVNRPRLLLADDPTRQLDAHSALEGMRVFQRLNEQGLTILLVTHDRAIADHARRVVTLEHGALRDDGPARRIVLEGRSR